MPINTIITVAIVVIATWCFYYCRNKRNRLHVNNQKKATQLLKELQRQPYPPGYIFGRLRSINPFVFEELLLICFKKRGYRIKPNTAYTGDGGIDGTFYDKKGHCYLIQAKRYRHAVNPQHVKAFAQLIENKKAKGGFFIHTGRTGLKSYYHLTPKIKIVSGQRLLTLLNIRTL